MTRVEQRREKSRMIGDALREIGILVAVFLPLDAFFERQFTFWTVVFALLLAGAFMWWGMILEGTDDL